MNPDKPLNLKSYFSRSVFQVKTVIKDLTSKKVVKPTLKPDQLYMVKGWAKNTVEFTPGL